MMNKLDYIYFHLYSFLKRLYPHDFDTHLTTVIPLSFTLAVILDTIIDIFIMFCYHESINNFISFGIAFFFLIIIHYIYINKRRGEAVIKSKIYLYNKRTSIIIFSLLVFILVFCLMILPAIFKETGIYDRSYH